MKYLIVKLPYCNVSPKGRKTYKSDGWVYTQEERPNVVGSYNVKLLERNEEGLYFLVGEESKRLKGDMGGNRFEVTINDNNTITFKHIPAEGAPLFKCHTRLDGQTLERRYKNEEVSFEES